MLAYSRHNISIIGKFLAHYSSKDLKDVLRGMQGGTCVSTYFRESHQDYAATGLKLARMYMRIYTYNHTVMHIKIFEFVYYKGLIAIITV